MNLLGMVCRYFLIACLGGLLLSVNLFAEDEATESLLVPWPMRLQTTWWDDFSKVDVRQLEQKIKEAKADLAFIKEPDSAANIAQQISLLFDQYYQKRTTPLLIKAPVSVDGKAQYSLTEVQKLVSERHKAESELQLMTSGQATLTDELRQRKTEVVAAAVVYKRLQKDSENNLLEGLAWIEKQLNQALVSLNSSVSSQRIKDQENLIKHLQARIELFIERLVVLPDVKAKAEQSLAQQTLIAKSHEEVLESLKAEALALNPDSEAAQTKNAILGQKILNREAALKLTKARIMGHQLTLDIASFGDRLGDKARDRVRDRLQLAEAYFADEEDWLTSFKERLRQEAELVASIKDVAEKSDNNKEVADDSRAGLVKNGKKVLAELIQFRQDFELLISIVGTKLSMSARGAEVLVERADDTIRQSWKKFKDLMRVPLFSINNTPVNSFGMFNFLMIIFIGWLITRFFRHAVKRVSERSSKGMQASSVATLTRIFSIFLLSIALLVGFSSLGIDVTKLALVATALSIGIGFGLQNIINNFVSGIILLFERSMKVGDYIELPDGVVGEVREINIRSTVVTTNSNIDIIVPNSEFVNNSVTNWTMTDGNLRIKLPFTVAYGCDKELLRKVVLEAVLKQPYTLNIIDKHYPQLRLSSFGDNALDFDLVVWIKPGWSKRPGRVKAAYNWMLDDVLREHEFEIPFPQRDIHIRSDQSEKPELILSSGQITS